MIIFTTTKELNKQFTRYTKLIYSQCGRKLSKQEEIKLENHIKTISKEITLINIIKRRLKMKKDKCKNLVNSYTPIPKKNNKKL